MASEAVHITPVVLPADEERILGIDRSIETDRIYRVVADPGGFRLIEEPISPPMTKTFPFNDLREGRRWDRGWLAELEGKPVGFIAAAYEPWNRRIVIWHFYVSLGYRGRGVGRRLLDEAIEDGVARGAASAWLETSNVNVPGIDAYRRLGFELCGVDVSLYEATAAEGEAALFLRRPLRRD